MVNKILLILIFLVIQLDLYFFHEYFYQKVPCPVGPDLIPCLATPKPYVVISLLILKLAQIINILMIIGMTIWLFWKNKSKSLVT
jgi:hypothetical protein